MKPIRIVLAFVLLSATVAIARGTPRVEVFKSASCGCCSGWVGHMRQYGFEVTSHDVSDVAAERRKLGMPDRLTSCHTAKVGGYVIEGHVPAADIRRLLKEKPQVLGLAVPSMVTGSPGMDGPKMAYDTLLVARDGSTSVFVSH
ncbi:MAG: DUF411 domain-containing protein [Sulfuritalea sp.]|nr:DUF411 domain-containing protein [Sulfuritalea sp.]